MTRVLCPPGLTAYLSVCSNKSVNAVVVVREMSNNHPMTLPYFAVSALSTTVAGLVCIHHSYLPLNERTPVRRNRANRP